VDDDVLVGLSRSYLFEDISMDQLRPLASSSRARGLARDEVLIRVGDRADELYVVLSGELKDSVVDAEGSEIVHFLHGPGMTIGEPGYFAVDRNRIVEVVATQPTRVVRLARRELTPFMVRHPSTKDRALEKLASNQRWQTTMISSLATKPLVDRLVLRLIELADSQSGRQSGPPTTPRVSQAALASMIGVSRENVNRALATLAANGAIRRENGRYVLVEADRLRQQLAGAGGPFAQRRDHRTDGDPTGPRRNPSDV
jgi:CRP/FNR family transcriptional regulator, cyclic AMP receptor protein